MKRYGIKHTPTCKLYTEYEGCAYIVDIDEPFITYGKIEDAEYMMLCISDVTLDNDGKVFTEDGEYPFEEFEITEI